MAHVPFGSGVRFSHCAQLHAACQGVDNHNGWLEMLSKAVQYSGESPRGF
jgi:hypothetical protein